MFDRREFVLFSAASAAAAPVAAAPIGKAARASEVRNLRAFAEATHPRGCEAAADSDWRKRWAALEASADRIQDGAYYIGLRRALGWFGDGHTTVLPFEFTGGVPEQLRSGPFARTLPLQVRVFHDGAFVTAAETADRMLLGRRVERVGALSVNAIVRAHAVDWPGNIAWAHRWSGTIFESPALLQGLGAIADPTGPVQINAGGESRQLAPVLGTFTRQAELERAQTDRESWAKSARGGNYVRPLAEHHALYISIDDMDDVEGKTFTDLTRDAIGAMARPEVERIVVDLRRNGGGNNFYGEPLRKAIEASRFNRPGGLYVLISPMTFSAAQNLANRLERETFAIFVGEPTGGAPNHYGDARPVQGKATGITAIVSTLPWFDSYPQDQRPWIMPDLFVPSRFEDWRSGRDRALDVALADRRPGTPDFLSRESAFFYDRKSQKADWKPFWI